MKLITNPKMLERLLPLNTEEQTLAFYFANNLIVDTADFTVSDFTKIIIDVRCEIDFDSIDRVLNSLVEKGIVKKMNEYWYQFTEDMFFNSQKRESSLPPHFYPMQYDTREWKQRRSEIMIRDNGVCIKCGNDGEHVHHKAYFKGFAVWEYADEYLETLCVNCHTKVHAIRSGKDLVSKDVVKKYDFVLNSPRIEKDIVSHIHFYYKTMYENCYVNKTESEPMLRRFEIITSGIKGVDLDKIKQEMTEKVAELIKQKEAKDLRKSIRDAKSLLPPKQKVVKEFKPIKEKKLTAKQIRQKRKMELDSERKQRRLQK